MMKLKNFLSVNLLLLMPAVTYAHVIAITATQPFPAQMNFSSTATAVYTVTNISSRVPFKIIDQSQFPSGLTIASSTCGNLMGPGQSCVITLRLTTASVAQTINAELREWASPSADGVKSPISVQVIPAPSVRIAAGNYSDNATNQFPLIAVSTNGGSLWSYPVQKTGYLPLDYAGYASGNGQSIFNSASCVGPASSAICIAGANYTDGTLGYPFLALSLNGGSTWSYPIQKNALLPFDYSDFGGIGATSCTGLGTTALCIAGGSYADSNIINYPMLAASRNGGRTWSYVIDKSSILPPGYASLGAFLGASCSASNTTGPCIAVGRYADNISITYPLVALSTNNGVSWSYPINKASVLPTDYSAQGYFQQAWCSGMGANAVCLASGSYADTTTMIYPLLAISTNGGSNWSYPIQKGGVLPSGYAGEVQAGGGGTFAALNCSGTGTAALCAAAGGYSDSNHISYPFIAISPNGGLTWSYTVDKANALPIGFIDGGGFAGVSCNGNSVSGACVAVGGYSDGTNSYPMIAFSTNSGKTWSYSVEKSRGLPADFGNTGSLSSIACDGSGSTAVCTAAGFYIATNQVTYPLIALSINGGATWTYVVSSASALPAQFGDNGQFGAAAVAVVASFADSFDSMETFGARHALKKLIKPY
jgi:hypothetical protein